MHKPDLAYVLFRRFVIQKCLVTGELLTEELIFSFWNEPHCERDGWEALAKEAAHFQAEGEMTDIPPKIKGEEVAKVN